MVMNGAELLTVSRILGHKTINMTLRYAHLSPSYQREAMNRLKIINGPQMVPRQFLSLAQNAVSRYPVCVAGVVELPAEQVRVDTRGLKTDPDENASD